MDASDRPRPANRRRVVVQGAAPGAFLRVDDEAATHGITGRFADLSQHPLERLSRHQSPDSTAVVGEGPARAEPWRRCGSSTFEGMLRVERRGPRRTGHTL